MRSNYQKCLAITLRYEGGFVNHPADPGGATNRGVTQKVYDAWRLKTGMTPRDVRQIADDEVEAIYRRQYWSLAGCDDMPSGIDLALFDYAVNSGVTRAVRDFQRVLGVRADGDPGSVTAEAAIKSDHQATIEALCDARLQFVRSLKTFRTFGKGWTRRINEVRAAAVDLVDNEVSGVHMDYELAGGADLDAIASGPADPRDTSFTSTRTGQGTVATSVGLLGSTATEAAEKLEYVSGYSEVIKLVFVALLLGGLGLTAYSTVQAIKEGRTR
ncbi:glycoside hydrolase family 108 protein [Alsobacter sp. R-9]